eukprot:1156973-Pelagomonas_calceolata.AAC.3
MECQARLALLPTPCGPTPPPCPQICRDSIPLFVRDSFAVTDSVSLERQSLNGLEPFGRAHLPMQAAPASAVPQTPAAPLGTLHEEASFMEELPPKVSARAPMCVRPMAELQRPSQTPGAMQRSAVRAARAASAAGFDDHDLSDLPDNLPDPMMISPAPAPPPQQPRPQNRMRAHLCDQPSGSTKVRAIPLGKGPQNAVQSGWLRLCRQKNHLCHLCHQTDHLCHLCHQTDHLCHLRRSCPQNDHLQRSEGAPVNCPPAFSSSACSSSIVQPWEWMGS